MSTRHQQPVLILGGGINGAAAARELLLNGVPVWLVDAQDIAGGATARSSRLIHGGLRYLEYGDFALVRESLAERGRLRRLAPQFVEPLRLYIPLSRRLGGWLGSGLRFLQADRWPWLRPLLNSRWCRQARGLWLVRLGLGLYDRFSGEGDFEKPRVVAPQAKGTPRVDARRYRWQCAYGDGQMRYPERFVIALLEDARRLAAENEVEFRVLTYHHAEPDAGGVRLKSLRNAEAPAMTIQPRLIVNATGAWGDLTLSELGRKSTRLFGGTKGSHFLTHHSQLRAALGDGGIYAEADDGRLVFVLPFGESVLVGTTDERFDDRPERAVATDEELSYLLELVGELFPEIELTAGDIDMHYAGVRPLPYRPVGRTGAISRGHAIVVNDDDPRPVVTLVGGKLTTCRALAEDLVSLVAGRLNLEHPVTSRDRMIPGAEDFPPDRAAVAREQQRLAEVFSMDIDSVRAVWTLCGTATREVLEQAAAAGSGLLPGTRLPLAFVRRAIEREWAATLDDLVERRLMLLFQPDLSIECLRVLADCLVEAGRLEPSRRDEAIDAHVRRLHELYGKQVAPAACQLAAE